MKQFNFRRSSHVSRYRSLTGWWPSALLVGGVLPLGWGWLRFFSNTGDDIAFIGPLVGATIAAVAIVYGAHQTYRVQRIRYTLDIIGDRLSNQIYVANATVFSSARRDGTLAASVDLTALSTQSNHPTLAAAVIQMLNHWELRATAYCREHLDRKVFEDTVSDLIVDLVMPSASIIGEMRREDLSNIEFLTALFFCFATPVQRSAVVPLLGPAPYPLCDQDRTEWQRRYKGMAFAG